MLESLTQRLVGRKLLCPTCGLTVAGAGLPADALVLLLVLGLFALGSSIAAEASGPDPVIFIKDTAERLFDALEREAAAVEADPAVAQTIVTEIIAPHFDLQRISRWVLGKKQWVAANQTQRDRFIHEFRTLLISTYSLALSKVSRFELDYLSAGGNDNKAMVTVLIPRDGAQPINVSYRLHMSNPNWKLYDVVVEGVSLVASYRATFASQIRQGGVDGLIATLVEKNQRVGQGH